MNSAQPIQFVFGECEASMVVRSVVAVVDHLCAEGDVEYDLLEALEVPLSESLGMLHERGIDEVVIAVEDDDLSVRITTRRSAPGDSSAVFGASIDMITPFFDVVRCDGHVVELRGAVR